MTVLIVGLVVSFVLGGIVTERQSRRWQREEWARLVKRADDSLQSCKDGYVIESVEFRPGFFTGRGVARWTHASGGTAVFETAIDAPRFTTLGEVK